MGIEARQRESTSERGTALVEAAIILPMFLMLLFGVFEAGRFMNAQNVLTNAAREGARFAVGPQTLTTTLPSSSAVKDQVNNFLGSAGLAAASFVSGSCPSTHSATPSVYVDNNVQVVTGTVTTTYTQVCVDEPYTVLTAPGFFSVLQVTLRGDALMRNETSE